MRAGRDELHPRSAYLRAMLRHRLVPVAMTDLTPATLPYWELRAGTSLVTGVENAFVEAYRDESLQYMLIAADRV